VLCPGVIPYQQGAAHSVLVKITDGCLLIFLANVKNPRAPRIEEGKGGGYFEIFFHFILPGVLDAR
jgi:hypothetical protein